MLNVPGVVSAVEPFLFLFLKQKWNSHEEVLSLIWFRVTEYKNWAEFFFIICSRHLITRLVILSYHVIFSKREMESY